MSTSDTRETRTNGSPTNVSPIIGTSIHAKMARAQSALQRVSKNGVNEHFHYKFASESDIKDAVREVCAAEGLFVHATVLPESVVESEVTTRSGQSLSVKLTVKLTIFDAEGQSIEPTFATGYAIDSSDKAYNKAQTAGIKFATIAAFNVSTGDDPDGHSPEHGARAQTRRASEPPTPTAGKSTQTATISPPNPVPQPVKLIEDAKLRRWHEPQDFVFSNKFPPSDKQMKLLFDEINRTAASTVELNELAVDLGDPRYVTSFESINGKTASAIIDHLKSRPSAREARQSVEGAPPDYVPDEEDVPF